jgi:hypothetical protein
MLNTDPSGRPNINEIIYHLENISQSRSIQLSESLTFLKKTESMLHAQFNPAQAQPSASAGVNNPAPSSFASPSQNVNHAPGSQAASASSSHWAGNASSLFKGGNSFFKTIKDASSKVIDTVQQ